MRGGALRPRSLVHLALPALLLGACSHLPEAAAPIPTVRAEAVRDGALWLQASGVMGDPAPEPIVTPVPWLPIEAVAEPGSVVEAGDPLLELSVAVLELWMANREVDMTLERVAQQQQALAALTESHELGERRSQLEAEEAVHRARIASSRQRDTEQLAVARLELEAAQARLDRQRRQLADLRERHRQGLASDRELAEAVDALTRREAQAEVAEIHHRLVAETTGSTVRYREAVRLARVEAELGSGAAGPAGGLLRRLAMIAELRAGREREVSSRLTRLQDEHERDRRVLADPYVRASSAGVPLPSAAVVRPGSRPGPAAAGFVVDGRVRGCRVEIPDAWRELARVATADDPESGRALVSVPALGLVDLAARVVSVQSLGGGDGAARRTVADIHLAEDLAGFAEGMTAVIRLRIPVPADAQQLPLWAMQELREPTVLLADGRRQELRGFPADAVFLVLDGLAPGAPVRVPLAARDDQARRVTGQIEAVEQIALEGRPWRTQILEMVPDGATVASGDVVARFASTRGRDGTELLQEAEQFELEAEETLLTARIDAETRVGKAWVTWRKALAEEQLARFEHLVERYGTDDEGIARAHSRTVAAGLDLAAAQRRLTAMAPERRDLSELDRHRAGNAVRRASLTRRRAELDAVLAGRFRSWVSLRRRQFEARRSADAAVDARAGLSLVRVETRIAMDRARRKAGRRRAEALGRREESAALVLRAPVAGQVFRQVNGWRPLRVGDRLHVRHPFVMPTGLGRRVRLEMPAHSFGRYRRDDAVPLRVPALGPVPVSAEVEAVEETFRVPATAIDELAVRGSVGVPARVYGLVLRLPVSDPPPPPGSIAWLELDR